MMSINKCFVVSMYCSMNYIQSLPYYNELDLSNHGPNTLRYNRAVSVCTMFKFVFHRKLFSSEKFKKNKILVFIETFGRKKVSRKNRFSKKFRRKTGCSIRNFVDQTAAESLKSQNYSRKFSFLSPVRK